jgi:hypothetical protein
MPLPEQLSLAVRKTFNQRFFSDFYQSLTDLTGRPAT